jgi:hypothetical protein
VVPKQPALWVKLQEVQAELERMKNGAKGVNEDERLEIKDQRIALQKKENEELLASCKAAEKLAEERASKLREIMEAMSATKQVLREKETELEETFVALKSASEEREKVDAQEDRIEQEKNDELVSMKESLKDGRHEHSMKEEQHRRDDLAALRASLQELESLKRRLAELKQCHHEQGDRQGCSAPVTGVSYEEIRIRLNRFQTRALESLDHMADTVATLSDQTDANTRRMAELERNKASMQTKQDSVPQASQTRLAAAKLVHNCVVRKLLGDITNSQAQIHPAAPALAAPQADGEVAQGKFVELEAANELLKTEINRLQEKNRSSERRSEELKAENDVLHEKNRSWERQELVRLTEVHVATSVPAASQADATASEVSNERLSNEALEEENNSLKNKMQERELAWQEERLSWQRQNEELVLTVRMLMQEKQQLDDENKHISETAAIFEKKYEEIAGQNARMMGHINHKQKIQQTLRLKEEISELRCQLASARKHSFKLESDIMNKHFDELIDSCASFNVEDGKSEKMKIDLQHLVFLLQEKVRTSQGEDGDDELKSITEQLRSGIQQRKYKKNSEGSARGRSRSVPRMAR